MGFYILYPGSSGSVQHMLPFYAGKIATGAPVVKNPLAKVRRLERFWVRSMGQEDPLEEITATHSTILAWRILQTEEPGRPQFMGSQSVRHD